MLILLTLVAAPAVEGQLVTSSIRGYWKLDETSGSTATDSSGQGRHGTYTSSPTLGQSGVVGNAVGFGSSTTSRLSIPNTALNGVNSLSISFWIRTTDTGINTIVSAANGSQSNEIWMYIYNGQLNLRYDGGSSSVWNLNSLYDGNWHHIVVVTNDSSNQTTVYQDTVSLGTQWKSPSGSLSISSGGLLIGQDQDCLGGCFESSQRLVGDLDELYMYNRAITSTEVALLYGFLGHWKLNESWGSTATDSSPVGNNGTYQNGVDLNEGGPYPGSGVTGPEFDGSNDYVSIGNESYYDVTGPLTVAVWLKVDQFDLTWQAIVAKGDSAWRLSRNSNDGRLHFACSGLSPQSVESVTSVDDDLWHHVVAVYDGSTLSLYIDGSLDNSVSASGSISTNGYNVYIAENSQATGRYWDGWLYDVRLYARALTATEIAELYGLVGRWKLDESSGTTAFDSSLMGKNGTYTNGVTLGGSGPYSSNKAAQFDGNNDYVNLPTYTTDFSGGYTISVWGRPTNSGYWARFADFGRGEDLDNFFFGRQASTSTLESTIHDGSLGWRYPITEANAIVNNSWKHYTVTVDSEGKAKLYVDAEVVEGEPPSDVTIGVPSNVTRTSNFIARSNWGVDDYFQGKMHDLQLYNRALSASEVQEIMLGADTGEGIRIMTWVEAQ
jgi:hypothetical protein